MRRRIVLFCLIIFSSLLAKGQDFQDNRRCKTISTNSIITDAELISPASITLPDSIRGSYKIEQISSRSFRILGPNKSIEVCYRILPAEINRGFKLKSIGKYDSSAYFRPPKPQFEPLFSQREELFNLGEINQGGQISRGITVGNTQDLFVNSSLNLNLEGKISKDLNIRASITDQSIPYQPEGNTQQLQDFDNVYVELYNDKFSVTGGDVVLSNTNNRFLRYLKNVQGGLVGVNLENSTTQVGLSSAKGQFASVILEVTEGVLGPYRVPSTSGSYLIILANSEKVYIDGQLVTRGYDNDYVIDYNQAEITFTSNVVITKYSRVRVDYEYAVQSYNRSVATVGHTQQFGRLTISAEYYRESDNRNQPLFYNLSQDDKELLASVGNDVDLAVVSGARLEEYSSAKVLYVKLDTINSSGSMESIYKYSKVATDSLYTVSFADIGEGKGSYVIAEYLAQGKVYQWVGQGLGSFAPYRRLDAPGRKEMIDLSAKVKTGEHSEIYLESAFSNQDNNLFSEIGNERNNGMAVKAGARITEKQLRGIPEYKLSAFADLEYLDDNFSPIDRFRRVEFDRDWSYTTSDSARLSDLVAGTGFGLRKDAANGLDYAARMRTRDSSFSGWQHDLKLNKSLGKLQFNAQGFIMKSDQSGQQASWKKLFAEGFYKGKIQPGYRFKLQQNLVFQQADSILASANYFTTHEFFIRNNPLAKTRFEASYSHREDRLPIFGEMNSADRSQNARLKFSRSFENGHNVNLVMNYRLLDDLTPGEESIASMSGRLDWNGDLIRNVFRQELNYSVSNARVPQREYIFVEVPTGEGTHTWRDDNQDGLKDLDEFYEAIHFDERNFIKLYVNTTEFHDAYENTLNYRATLRAPRSWRAKGGILNILSRLSNTTSWTSHYRTTENSLNSRLIPFLSDLDEQQVLSLKEALRSTVFINKANPKFGVSTGYAKFRKKYLYSNGFESRSDEEVNLSIRWNITRQHNVKLTSLTASRANRSDYLAGRNYDIRDYKLGPSFSYQPKPTLRITGSYVAGFKYSSSNTELPTQSATNELIGEVKMGIASRYLFNLNLRYSKLSYDGDELTPVGYEMLQGLRPGNNLLWTISWQQKLINGLQLNFFYEGRKPEGIAVIHSGRASVSALF